MNRLRKIVLFFFLASMLEVQGSLAQYYLSDIQKFSIENGLSNRFINDVNQDSRGFIWVATNYGLNRFDGYEFKKFTKETDGLSSNLIFRLHESYDSCLWVCQKSPEQPGLYISTIDVLNIFTGEISSFADRYPDAPFAASDIVEIRRYGDSPLIIATRQAAVFVNEKDGNFRKIYQDSTNFLVEEILFDAARKYIWLTVAFECSCRKAPGISACIHRNGIKHLALDLDGNIVEQIVIDAKTDQTSSEILWVDDESTLWLRKTFERNGKTVRKLFFKKSGQSAKEYDFPSLKNTVYHADFSTGRIYQNSGNGHLWYFGENEFFVFDPLKGPVLNIESIFYDQSEGVKLFVKYIFFDTNNNAWLITDDGLYRISLIDNRFTHFLSRRENSSSYLAYSTRGMVEDGQGLLHVNTYFGRVTVNPKTGETQPRAGYVEKEKYWEKNGLAAIREKNGDLWFSSEFGFLQRYNPSTEKYTDYNYPYRTSVSLDSALHSDWALLEDRAGTIWIGTENGLSFLDTSCACLRHFKKYNEFVILGQSTVYHLFEEDQQIWVASSTGLYALEAGIGIVERYAKAEAPPHNLPFDEILFIHKDSDGIFWLGTKGGGLIRWNRESGGYRQFTTTDGLSDNVIYAIYEDGYGHLWMSSNYGLMRFGKETGTVNTYLPQSGISHEEFNTGSHYQASDGRLYFGGLNGINAFYPGDFVENENNSIPLQITGFQQYEGSTGELKDKTAGLVAGQRITLRAGDKSFILKFALLDFTSSKQNRYAYKIEGLENDWQYISENYIRVHGLPYGQYTLRVKGQGQNGVWSKSELSIPVVVLKPWYLKTWFIFLAGIIFLSAGPLFYKMRTSQLERQKAKLEEDVRERTITISRQNETLAAQAEELRHLDELKSRFFANISHELRTPLTLILGPVKALLENRFTDSKEKTNDILMLAKRNGEKLLSLIEEILDLSKLEKGKLELNEKPVAFNPFLHRIFSSFDSLAQIKGIHYQFESDVERGLHLQLDAGKFEKILNNLLSNAIKFTPKGGEVTLSVTDQKEQGKIQIEVTDTGQGIHPKDLPHVFNRYYQSKQPGAPVEGGTGIGLALAKEFAQLMKGELRVESTGPGPGGKGSTFIFDFPRQQVEKPLKMEPVPLQEEHYLAETPSDELAAQKLTVLIVEDNRDMLHFIQSLLSPVYQTILAENGQAALDILQSSADQPIDLILSDVMMPLLDGFQLLEKVKSDGRWRHLPMILLTARAGETDKLNALAIGVDDYMIKPFSPQELLARVKNLLLNYQSRQQWLKEQAPDEAVPDNLWLKEAEAIALEGIAKGHFVIADLADALSTSERQLFRIIKQFTGLTPNNYLKEIKLQKARQLLETKSHLTVAEVSYAVGFEQPGYFAGVYEQRFGKLPSEYLGS